ncbi:unnamed protein product [Cylicostephanus goldi]|uniref:Malate dehydrogenase, cytoplasmic n=1 Tax=Cylicostephanus goldi TaxID=71465 RepID=A0A3P6SI25_CYLGO|nr:unnamed protein product [Cylicostephanus goldi]
MIDVAKFTHEAKTPLRVLVTGAAGQIGYSLVLQIAKGDVFGKDTPLVLVLLDIPPMASALEGVKFELQDCALPNLIGKLHRLILLEELHGKGERESTGAIYGPFQVRYRVLFGNER